MEESQLHEQGEVGSSDGQDSKVSGDTSSLWHGTVGSMLAWKDEKKSLI